MGQLEDAVPPHEPAADTFAAVAKMGLSAVPVVGPMAVEAVSLALQSRQSARQQEFNLTLARALETLIDEHNSPITSDDVLGSDEFLAAVSFVQRVAAETESDDKRRRLAAAAANSGRWSSFAGSERKEFLRSIAVFEDLHVWALNYLCEPHEWLAAHGFDDPDGSLAAMGADPLAAVLARTDDLWHAPISQVLRDLAGFEMISLPTLASPTYRSINARTLEKGRRFLRFINETDPLSSSPPDV